MKKMIFAAAAVLCAGLSVFGAGATITWRIQVDAWESDRNFDNFVDFVKRHHLTGKIAFFTCDFHTPAKLSILLPRIEILKRRIAAMKALGYETGVNHLVTLGHVDEELDQYEDIPEAQRFTNIRGDRAIANYCPNDPVWRTRYLRPVYEALAHTGADFVWSDDDVRLQNHAVDGCGCYCPVCMQRLERLGYRGDRANFGAWLADAKDGERRRRAYLQFRRETVADLLAFLAGVVRGVDPKIVFGVMDCGVDDHTSFPEKFAALNGDAYPLYWRPGGGVYDDFKPDAILEKVNLLAQECAYIPAGVKCLESEIEDFNYQRLYKSVHFNVLEADVYTAVCTPGIAYNVMNDSKHDALEVSDEVVAALERNRPRLDAIAEATAHKPCRGVYAAQGRDGALGLWNGDGAAWLADLATPFRPAFTKGAIQKIGLPTAYRPEFAAVYAADEQAVRAMTDDEIAAMLAKGAYLSGDAAEELIRRGYGEDVGFDVVGEIRVGAEEEMLAHPLNADAAGRLRDARQSFWGGVVKVLKPHAGAQAVTCARNISGQELAPCVSGCFENRRGGRIFVAGYFAWDRLMWKCETEQLKRIFRWLSKDTLPGYVASYHRVGLWLRGEDAVVVYNMSADPARRVKLMLAGAPHALEVVGEGAPVRVGGASAGAYSRYVLPEMAPWSVRVFRRAGE